MAWRAWPIVLGACALAGAALAQPPRIVQGPGARTPPPERVDTERIERLERWIKSVARHVPGEEDPALADMAAWPNSHLKQLFVDASALVQTMARHIGDANATVAVRPIDQKAMLQVRYSRQQFNRLQVLACAAGGLVF